VVVNEVKTREKGVGLNIATVSTKTCQGGHHRSCHGHPFCTAERSVHSQNILTTEVIVADKPEENAGGGMPAGMGGGMGGMM